MSAGSSSIRSSSLGRPSLRLLRRLKRSSRATLKSRRMEAHAPLEDMVGEGNRSMDTWGELEHTLDEGA